MNLIKKLMGRRQFLIAAGLTSTCALTCKKVSEFIDRNFQTSTAMARTFNLKTTANKCPHLLSPLMIRNVVLKNRIMHTQSPPHCMQGPENYPADAFRNHYSNMAKNAAIVSLDTHFGTYPKEYGDQSDFHNRTAHHSDHIWQDIPPVHNYLNRMIDDIHCEGALVRYAGNLGGPPGGGGMPGGPEGGGVPGSGMPGGAGPGGGGPGGPMPQAQASQSIEDIVADAKDIEDQGYDVYGMNTNSLEAVQAVRSSTNLILVSSIRIPGAGGMGGDTSILHPWDYEGADQDWQFGDKTPGVTNVNKPTADELDQVVEAARQLEGLADIVWIRDGRHEHPNGFTQDKDRPFNLYYAEAIKKAGIKVLVCPSAGFHDPAQNDQFIASGITDIVGMTTPFFADPEFIKKIYEGRIDDIIPCIQCHNCHGLSRTHGPWYDTCDVNPKWATPAYKLQNIPAPTVSKKVAVIGGGPGGMKAALTSAERGHKVTLYEKSDALGGLLQFTDHTQWKWPYKVFKDWLIHQVNKAGIEVRLEMTATPDMIKAKDYDTVLVATGATPVISRMPGADASNVFNILTCHSNKNALGKNVVFIGAGRIGVEAALGICKDGHEVTLLCSGTNLIELEFIGPHNMMNQMAIMQNHPGFNFILEVIPKRISGGKVTYTDAKGIEKTINADSVVIYSGLKLRMDEAEKFLGSADQVLFLGDCTGKNGTIQKTIRNAFFVASQV